MTGASDCYTSFALSPERPRRNSAGSDMVHISSVSHLPAFVAQARSLADAEATISILRRAGEELKLVVEHLQCQLAVSESQIDLFHSEIQTLKTDLDSAEEDKILAAEKSTEKDAALAALRVRLDSQIQDNVNLRQSVEKELSEVFSQKISVLENRLREEKKKNSECETRLQHATLALTQAEKRKSEDLKLKTSEMENMRFELMQKLEISERTISDLKGQNSECGKLKQQIVQTQLALKNHVYELQSLKKEHSEIFEQKISRDQEYEFLSRRVKQLEKDKEISDREFSIALEKNSKLEQEAVSDQKQISTLTFTASEASQKLELLEELRKKVVGLEVENKSKDDKISNLHNEISDLQDQLFEQEMVRRELAAVQSRHREISAQLKTRETDNETLLAEQKSRAGVITSLELEISDWKRKFEEIQDERRVEKRRWREKTEGVQKTLNELGERVNRSQREKREVEQLASANKRKFEEKLLEYERRALIAELYRPPRSGVQEISEN